MELIRNAILPRRLTQMYADTKRSYEHIVQTNVVQTSQINSPQLSSLHRKLRIQKDRLFAWGLEWRDSGAAQSGDIDGSLDRAGISDLVASIMSSINELLEEAESMQPQRTREPPGAYPDDKTGDLAGIDVQFCSENVARFEDLVKDLTTSIDTLCDLSRTQQVYRRESEAHAEPQSLLKASVPGIETGQKAPLGGSPATPSLCASTRIYPNQLRIPESKVVPRSSPPSYESVTAGSEERVFAYLITNTSSKDATTQAQDHRSEIAVLLDYGCVQDSDAFHARLPSLQRYEDLVMALQACQGPDKAYTRTMKIVGWFEDPRRLRHVFVYEVPSPPLGPFVNGKGNLMPHNLLSYLQHGADSDSSNMPSLEDRYRLAFNLASSLLHLHAKGLTHRNINSNNILFFTEDASSSSPDSKSWKLGVIRHPFITSFDQCDQDACTPHEEPFISSIYRHPLVERGQRTAYRSAHDIYSLGLILLEIGLWMPIHKLWKPKYARADFKCRMQSVYIKKLAAKCGSTYMRVVDYCLRAADGDSHVQEHMQSSFQKSQEPAKLQTAYYWKALRPLERCCSIDDLEEPGARADRAEAAPEAEISKMKNPENPSNNAGADVQITPSTSDTSIQEPKPSIVNEEAKSQTQPKRKLKIWSHELPIPCAKHWYATMLPELERILKRIIDRWESYSIDLFMVGETAELARPTIYMMCASVEKARKALQHVNKEKQMFDIKVVRGQISRSKAGKKKRRSKKDDKSSKKPSSDGVECSAEDVHRSNPYYQEKPACGASIGAYLDKQHLPPVSFGGTVLVDGEPYGMSVHHMLENDELDLGLEDTVNLEPSMDQHIPFSEGIAGPSWCPAALPEALYPFEISEDESDEDQSSAGDDDSWLFDDTQSERDFGLDADVDMGDTLGIAPSQGKDLVVTQPAIDDVNGSFFPNEEDMDEEHLSSHRFGHIHASSGIKRANRGAISHEIDWALIKVSENRMRETNVVTGGALHCESKSSQQPKTLDRETICKISVHESASYPCQVVKTEELGGLRVHALGRTSGLQTGVILPAMTMVKMPGRISFSHSWQVKGNFGVGGDSGAWVMDNASGRVCAHVLAWSPRNNMAYIAPMEVLLDDIAHTLGAKVTLPQQESQASPVSKKQSAIDYGDIPSAIRAMQISDDDDDSITMLSHNPAAQQRSKKPRSPKATTFQTTNKPSVKSSRSKSRFDIHDRPSSPPVLSESMAYPTPSPSPPLPTSPPSLPLIDNIAQQRFPSTDVLRTISTTYAPPQSRREMLEGGRGGGMTKGMGKVEVRGGSVATKG